MTAHFSVDDDIDVDVACELHPGFLEEFNGEDMAGDAALHVAGAATVDATILDRGGPGIIAPTLTVANRDHVRVSVEQQ